MDLDVVHVYLVHDKKKTLMQFVLEPAVFRSWADTYIFQILHLKIFVLRCEGAEPGQKKIFLVCPCDAESLLLLGLGECWADRDSCKLWSSPGAAWASHSSSASVEVGAYFLFLGVRRLWDLFM